MEIRKATPSDAGDIHKLSWQLGYSPDLEMVKSNIETMLTRDDHELVVAVSDFSVMGWMSLAERLRIEDVAFLEVAAIVTDEKVRGQGVGRLLMEYAESVARKRKLGFVGLRSSVSRLDAHAFYCRLGYEKAKESSFFKNELK